MQTKTRKQFLKWVLQESSYACVSVRGCVMSIIINQARGVTAKHRSTEAN